MEVGAASQRLIPTGERSGLQTHIATTESASLLRADELLTAFLELASAISAAEHREEIERSIPLAVSVEELEKGMEVLTAQLKEQAAQVQKVSAQLERSRAALQVVKKISKLHARLRIFLPGHGRDHIIFA